MTIGSCEGCLFKESEGEGQQEEELQLFPQCSKKMTGLLPTAAGTSLLCDLELLPSPTRKTSARVLLRAFF